MRNKIAKWLRRIYLKKEDSFVFYLFEENPDLSKELTGKNTGIYIHIPFCKSMCPYCPYYRIPYDKQLSRKFIEALSFEIRNFYQQLNRKIDVTSIYIGGGTPSLMIKELSPIIISLKKYFNFKKEIAIETTPSDINRGKIEMIKEAGIDYISLGIQSFQQKYLTLIGRNYNCKTALQSLELFKKYHFDLLNIDLIFAFPGQSINELLKDLQQAVEFSPSQITCYPLFTFPYSTVGKFKRLKEIKMPPIPVRRKMYYLIHDFLENHGYNLSSVWSFNKNKVKFYSSVTRDYYVGFGPSAGTYTGENFYFNVFSVKEYIEIAPHRKPLSLRMNVTQKMGKLFWLYWRLYETVIPKNNYKIIFKTDIYHDFGEFLKLIKFLNLIELENDEKIVLNKKGCHWIHLAQNFFALNYVNKIWSTCQNNLYPEVIRL